MSDDLQDRIATSMDALGVEGGELESKQDRAYEFMVKYCRETGDLPGPTVIAKGCELTLASTKHTLDCLVSVERVARVGVGLYLPLLDRKNET